LGVTGLRIWSPGRGRFSVQDYKTSKTHIPTKCKW